MRKHRVIHQWTRRHFSKSGQFTCTACGRPICWQHYIREVLASVTDSRSRPYLEVTREHEECY